MPFDLYVIWAQERFLDFLAWVGVAVLTVCIVIAWIVLGTKHTRRH